MARRLPSLRGMRAFEAAARLGSLTRAALELNVTHAAISHQIRALETEVGMPLFLRQARGVLLTAQGERYLPALSRAFDLLDSASSELRERARHRPLVVSLSQGIAARWLMPRQHRFRLACPEIPLALVPSSRQVDLHRDEADIGLRYGDGDWPDLQVDLLLRPRITPVIGRRLEEHGPPLREPRDLRLHTLIHTERDPDWESWLAAAGAPDLSPASNLYFGDCSLTLAAASEGLGVAMGYSGFIELDLAAGILLQPFELSLPADHAYFVVTRPEKADDPRVARFRDWLRAEVEATPGVAERSGDQTG
jgi:LysR family glycine cleavage system transcriptional activator